MLASVAVQPTKQTTTTSGAGAKGKTIGGLEIVGFVLLVAVFGIYFFFFRKKMYPDHWSQPMVESPAPSEPAAAAQTALPEVGITHQAFVGDAESPTNVTAPETKVKSPEPEVKAAEPEVKVAEPEANVSVPEVKSEVKENETAEENFSEDSAL